jgi:hypothetical protein
MNIDEMWKKGKIRIEDGVLYSDGTFFPISGSPKSGYVIEKNESIFPLIENNPSNWFFYSVSSKQFNSKYNFVAGSGGYEGEGFVAALEKNGSLVWVIHLIDSECLEIEYCSEYELYVSGSEGYIKNSFVIPFEAPELFTHTLTKM